MSQLQHSGVKGMHWGVRHDVKRSKIGKHLDSLKRERQWHSVLKEVHNMTTKDITVVKRRVDLENSLKRLSKSKMATSKDKEDYLRRHEMDDQELVRKVNRLQAKDSLYRSVKDASKEQRELGIKVAKTAGSIGYKYVISRKAGTKLGAKDIIDAVNNPVFKNKRDVLDTGADIAASKARNKKLKNALELSKSIKPTKSKS